MTTKLTPAMATTNFYLKSENKNGKYPILLVYQDKGKKFKYYTKVQTLKDNWDGNRIKGKSLEVSEDNQRLQDLENIIYEIEREALRNKKIHSIDIVEQKFRIQLDIKSHKSEFTALYEIFIDAAVATKAEATIKAYKTTYNRLTDFSKSKQVDLSFENINTNFYNKFVNYLISDRGQLNNSVGKYIKNLKTFLNYVKNNELVKTNFNLNGFKILKNDIDIIALSQEELWQMYYVKDLPQSLEYVKDYFCFECFTGLRFSDISKLETNNIKGDFIELRTQKTRELLYIPLNSFAKEIIEKYQGKFETRPIPPTFSNQKSNEYIKDVAELAGIRENMIIEKFSGAKCITIRKQKCDLISTHTGRKTFITLSHERGMPIEMIMKITGIKKWETLKKYLKISEKAKLSQMNEFWNNKLKSSN